MSKFSRVSFTEAQLYAIDSIEQSAYTQGVWMGVMYSVGGIGGISIAVCLVGKYGHLIYQFL